MALSIYNIKKWIRMLRGKSIQHVNQGVGRCFSVSEIKGYYNDLTEKVSENQLLDKNGIPLFNAENGKTIYFPIMIFQYGLGAYDLYLLENKKQMLERMLKCANWALENQEESGGWRNFENEYPKTPYSSMAQGEGISLLVRAYTETKEKKFLFAAKEAVDFMLTDINKGGTTEYVDNDLFLHEFTHLSTVLNGWIFSLFGLYDYLLIGKDVDVKDKFLKSVDTLEKTLKHYDNGYWSMYNLSGMITSPFYHKLHIAQLQVMYDLTSRETFQEYVDKWKNYQKSFFKKSKAFIKKAIQKVFEK